MKRHKLSAIAVMAAFGLISLIAPAHADDEIETDAETVPAWKSFGGGDSEQLEETFFRLAQDFAALVHVHGSERQYPETRRTGAIPHALCFSRGHPNPC